MFDIVTRIETVVLSRPIDPQSVVAVMLHLLAKITVHDHRLVEIANRQRSIRIFHAMGVVILTIESVMIDVAPEVQQ